MKSLKMPTVEARTENQQNEKLSSLEEWLRNEFWTATDAALIMISVDPFGTMFDELEGWCLSFLPGRNWSYWNDEAVFGADIEQSRRIGFSRGKHAIDTPLGWIKLYQHWKLEIPWLNIAKQSPDFVSLLESPSDPFSPEEQLRSRKAKNRLGAEKTNETRTNFQAKKLIHQHFQRWQKNSLEYANASEFKAKMIKEFWHPDAVQWMKDLSRQPGGKTPAFRNEKSVIETVEKLLESQGSPAL
jgi:hypothetical protein